MVTSDTVRDTVLDAGTRRALLGRVYAESLLTAALKESQQAALDVGEEMLQLRVHLIEHPEVAEFLASPALGKKGKLAFLDPVLKGNASPLLRGLLHALWKNNRLDLFRNVVGEYLKILDERAGRVRVTVTASAPLTDDQKNNLVETLRARLHKEPVVTVRVDPDLLGGMIVKAGDTVIDTSVRSRLRSLRTLLLDR
jgi:F-type H+-transporting ATPase subunit delta